MAAKHPAHPGTDPQVIDYIRANYGYLAAFLNIPQVGKIILQAGKEGWDASRLQGAISQTQWWKSTSQTAREWDALTRIDPAQAKQRLTNTIRDLQTTAASMGISISGARYTEIATNALRLGLSSAQIQQALGAEYHYNPQAAATGTAGATISQIKKLASDYLVPIGNDQLGHWTQLVLEGKTTANDFQNYLKDQAKSLYPTLASSLDRGMTVQQYVSPYGQIAGKELNVDPNAIDWTDPKWQQALTKVDPATGQRAPMSLDQWQQTVRTDSRFGYDQTANARDAASGFAQNLLSEFGFGPGGQGATGL